ncbi:MAG: PadR family transcriptional regulator [Candidatus Bathyarchaeota archaeon]|nr:PadR family transcriptional regulator [Candidatus Termiticorpusculum sp.]MCL2867832.1 PadR family transcriptional regulator [Candidatus Termiticorpusculum sp.]
MQVKDVQVEAKVVDWLKESQRGYIRIAILILLNKNPHHGYEIMKSLNELTNGFWKPTAGGIYPILQDLEKFECIKGEWDLSTKRARKTYVITSNGKTVLDQIMSKEFQLVNIINKLVKECM